MKFQEGDISIEDGFWTMFYFLKEHYDLSGGTFDISCILSASEPMPRVNGINNIPADSSMIDYWNEAFEKFKDKGIPPFKELKK